MNWKRIFPLLFLLVSEFTVPAADEGLHECGGGKGCDPQFIVPAEALSRASQGSFPKPPAVSRTAWGCPDGQSSRWTPQYTTVTHLLVHHSAGANTSSDWRGTVRGIWRYHTEDRGWGDIGYNYLIDPNGVIYEGRAGGDNVIAAHFSCRNGGTFGVCLLGDFTSVSPTASALASLKKLLGWKTDQRGFDPAATALHAGTGLNLYRISGHRNGNEAYPENACTTTSCPGTVLYNLLPSIRRDVQELMDPPLPSVLTLAAINVGSTAAELRGSIMDQGGSSILERRFEWAKASVGWGAGVAGDDFGVIYHAGINGPNSAFSATLANLQPCTQYRYRVYARNSAGWSDMSEVNVVTFETASMLLELQLTSVRLENGQIEFQISGPCGVPFVAEKSENLTVWSEIEAGEMPQTGSYAVQEAFEGTKDALFFRARRGE